MKLTTSYRFVAEPDKLWPLLFDSKMDDRHPCFLLCGLPKPIECRLTEDGGGVGKERQCVSDKGIIHQEITAWEPNELLEFQLRETNIYFGPCVDSIRERFEIKKINNGKVTITRITDFKAAFPASLFVYIPMFIGLKSIHHYVFRNWKRMAQERKQVQ